MKEIEHEVSEAASIDWCKQTFRMLSDGGTWGVPRSGLIFHKRGDKFVLTAAMPYDANMPITEYEFQRQQQEDFDVIKEMFGLAGVEVTGNPAEVRHA